MPAPADESSLPPVVLMWENLGPTHHDRLRALARAGFPVEAIELHAASGTYTWEREAGSDYRVTTLGQDAASLSGLSLVSKLVSAVLGAGARHVFLCHYDDPRVLAAAAILRLRGRRVYTMADSKFDDFPRSVWRETAKSVFLWPYNGAIVASRRSREYLAFLGIPERNIALGYDTIDTARLRHAARDDKAEPDFAARPFLVVARLVEKKNIPFILAAFADYRKRHADQRELHVIGYGPLEASLKTETERLGLGDSVKFLGFQSSPDVAAAMGRALALVLASTEEQFGLVVNEALCAGLPVIVSNRAGAVDVLVENLGNGVVIDPADRETLILAMAHMAGDEARWKAMRERALATAERGEAAHFCAGVRQLVLPRTA